MALPQNDIDYFKRLLDQQLQELTGRGDDTVEQMGVSSSQFPDPTDRASSEANDIRDLRIRDRERKLIEKIKEALERIDNGVFGICEDCEDEIGVERLKARPVTTLCIECKQYREKTEKKR